ncbi:MAG TPA: DUF2064 domain-containing protein [Syntrophomonadaceae bacterium]|nr:DUF2064 domain-containing protein [Syntrophomonadaceae bacterium]
MKKAICVFTKVPRVGDIKTRLTTEKGGILDPEEAKDFYEAVLLDVIDAAVACEDCDVYVVHNKTGDREYLDNLFKGLSDPSAIKGIFKDQGGTFDECIQYAADTILKNGSEDRLADALLLVGGDLPSLQSQYLQQAFAKLEKMAMSPEGLKIARKNGVSLGAGLVEGSCQEGGFSIVGFTCTTPFDFHGVFYNQDGVTALDALVEKAADGQIPFALIQNVPDVDIPVDMASMIPELKALELASKYDPQIKPAKRVLGWLEELGITTSTGVPHR